MDESQESNWNKFLTQYSYEFQYAIAMSVVTVSTFIVIEKRKNISGTLTVEGVLVPGRLL